MSANDKQVGGEHYKAEYQHWDFVCDTNMHYLLGCATKYLCRYKEKNGLQDLEKAKHYIQKAKEVDLEPMLDDVVDTMWDKKLMVPHPHPLVQKLQRLIPFNSNCSDIEGQRIMAFINIFCGNWDWAVDRINDVIELEYGGDHAA